MSKLPARVRKRDNSLALFEPAKIERAVLLAARSALADKKEASRIARAVTEQVLARLGRRPRAGTISIENIQDLVEEALIAQGYAAIAKSYILYRKQREDIRQAKTMFGVRDDLKLPINALLVLQKRYLLKDDATKIIETPRQLFQRVARAISQAELNYASEQRRQAIEEAFFNLMSRREFLPNSPTLMNAGTSIGQLSACFVLPVADALESIFETVKHTALIHRTGGGTGFDFSRLRPRGDLVSTTKGKASGPVSFMSIFNQTTDVIIQGGRRRGANMGIMRCDHPDIFEFVEAKLKEGSFANFNLSVAATDRFIEAARHGRSFELINPVTQKKARTISAKALFDLICFTAWRTGDPGLIFLDEINRRNPTPVLGQIEATNPCSEVLLLPYESCNLGSINLAAMVQGSAIDWGKLRAAVHMAVRFLDNVIDINRYPLEQIKDIALANRKIGLGVMGCADLLIKLGIPYITRQAENLARRVMLFIRQQSLAASRDLAAARGTFPNLAKSIYAAQKLRLRNATLNAIAPTGTISIIAGCSSGIEPLFSLSHIRTVMGGTRLVETHPLFETLLQQAGVHSRELMNEIRRAGSIQNLAAIPENLRRLFVTSFDVAPEQHLKVQAAFQKHTDNSVSKTVNLPHDATVDDVRTIYLTAHRLKCKGITIYRYGSRAHQVLAFDEEAGDEAPGPTAPEEGCRSGTCTL